MKKQNARTLLMLIATGALCLTGTTTYAQYKGATMLDQATRESRAGRYEFYAVGGYWHGESSSSHNVTVPTTLGSSATGDLGFEFDDTGVYGFGMGYNLNNHVAFSGEFQFGYPRYTVNFLGSSLSGEAFMHSGK